MEPKTVADEAHEHGGLLWRRLPGAESSFEQFAAARTFLIETFEEARWNPWVRDERKQDLNAAMAMLDEWTRAEPGFRQWAEEETEAYLEQGRRERDAERAADEARWERDKARFDPELFASRRALLEQESIYAHLVEELEEFRSGRRFPGMVGQRRDNEIAELGERLATCEARIATLRTAVPDPESVVSERGQLPRDRRYANLLTYKYDREYEVRELKRRVPELRAELKRTTDKEGRKRLRKEVADGQAELNYWLSITPLTGDDMCSECATPLARHGWVSHGLHGARPCAAWPGWAARVQEMREMFIASVERNQKAATAAPPPLSRPQPLAVVPSGLSLSEVVARLAQLQTEYPDAIVKRGRANRWELWPTD